MLRKIKNPVLKPQDFLFLSGIAIFIYSDIVD